MQNECGNSSVGRASVSQAEGRRFESHLPLFFIMKILSTLLQSLLPLIVYIVIDAFLPLNIAIAAAICFGILQFLFFGIFKKQRDKFILVDTALLTLLVVVSIISNDEIFFLWKPALIEAIMLIFITIIYFSNINILLKLMGHYMDFSNIDDAQKAKLHQTIGSILILLIIHIALIIYYIYNLSHQWWAFISSVLIYIIFGVWFVGQLLYQRSFSKKNNKELVSVLNDELKVVEILHRDEVHNCSMKLHSVIHLYIFNSEGRVLLQKRSKNKDVQPDKLDASVGGHVAYNKKTEQALMREAKEEIGLRGFSPLPILQYIWESYIEKELVFVYFAQINGFYNFKKNDELSELCCWSKNKIESSLNKNYFTPNFEYKYNSIIKNIWH